MARRHRRERHPAPRSPQKTSPPPRREPAAQPLAQPRRESGGWIYGRHAVHAALSNPTRRLHRLVATADLADDAKAWLAEAKARPLGDVEVETMDRGGLEVLLPEGAVHQGLALQAEPLPPTFLEDVLAEIPPAPDGGAAVVVVLDQVSDPHNVGAVLRSAAAFGARALVLPEHGTPSSTATLAKAASGALELVPLVRVTNLARALDKLKKAGFWCIGLEEGGEKLLTELDLSGRVALVLGAEGEGLRRLTRERCDFLARLPTRDPLASLNVSNAAAVALYEVARRRSS
ncbi:MAG TPA: 23S rRNA (guanosine(2251)-2'-O)-methyltransferase RlmB [Stellaceae bacterium]|nr:23S rRNA (guanosine(2251)-2'-O)-methyltransferase RlmB [Stellaceae bacterium]